MKKDLAIAAAAAAVILGVCFAVAGARADLPLSASRPYTPSLGAAKTLGKDDKIVMHVNGEPVTEREFVAFISSFPEEQQVYLATDPDGKARAAEELVRLKALEQEGRRLGADGDPEASTMIDFTRANVYARYALRKLVGKVDDKRLRAAYDKSSGEAGATEWSHIMIAYEGGQAPPRGGKPPISLAEAKKKAADLAAKIRAGARFEDVARIESDDPQTGPEGGRLAGVQANALPPEVHSLKPGEVSDPIQTPFGMHIFRVGAMPFEAVRPQIENQMMAEDARAAAERIAKAAKVELDPKFFPKKSAS